MVTLTISSIFAEAAHRLPKEAKAKLTKVYLLLTKDPRHPSLQVKKLEGAVRPDVYECRLNQFYRIILRQVAQLSFHLIYVGPHDEAIRYGLVLRESAVPYGDYEHLIEALASYLAGDDSTLKFQEISLDEFRNLSN